MCESRKDLQFSFHSIPNRTICTCFSVSLFFFSVFCNVQFLLLHKCQQKPVKSYHKQYVMEWHGVMLHTLGAKEVEWLFLGKIPSISSHTFLPVHYTCKLVMLYPYLATSLQERGCKYFPSSYNHRSGANHKIINIHCVIFLQYKFSTFSFSIVL